MLNSSKAANWNCCARSLKTKGHSKRVQSDLWGLELGGESLARPRESRFPAASKTVVVKGESRTRETFVADALKQSLYYLALILLVPRP